jgi:hypothetical protein
VNYRTSASHHFFLNAGDPPPVGGAAPPAPGAAPAVVVPPVPAGGDAPAPGADPAKPSLAGDPAKPGEPPKSAVNDPPPAQFDPAKLTLPEGMKADDPLFQKFSGLMTDDKLSPHERGQQMLNLYNDAVKQSRDAAKTAWDGVNTEWSKQTMALPEIGGAKWDSTKTTIAKAIDGLGADAATAFRQALDITGAGNHPAIVKALHSWASKLTEGGHIEGKGPVEAPKDLAKTFFPNSEMRK